MERKLAVTLDKWPGQYYCPSGRAYWLQYLGLHSYRGTDSLPFCLVRRQKKTPSAWYRPGHALLTIYIFGVARVAFSNWKPRVVYSVLALRIVLCPPIILLY